MTRILVVDDDDLSSLLIEAMLDSRSHEVTAASNGFEALDLVRTTEPHLVFVDLDMPWIDGIEVCRLIRRLAKRTEAHIVILSADSLAGEETEKARKAGANAVLEKPLSQAALSSLVAAARGKVRQPA